MGNYCKMEINGKIVDKVRLVIKFACFIVLYFCSLFILFVGLDRAQTAKGIIEMQMKNFNTRRSISTHTKMKQCTHSRVV